MQKDLCQSLICLLGLLHSTLSLLFRWETVLLLQGCRKQPYLSIRILRIRLFIPESFLLPFLTTSLLDQLAFSTKFFFEQIDKGNFQGIVFALTRYWEQQTLLGESQRGFLRLVWQLLGSLEVAFHLVRSKLIIRLIIINYYNQNGSIDPLGGHTKLTVELTFPGYCGPLPAFPPFLDPFFFLAASEPLCFLAWSWRPWLVEFADAEIAFSSFLPFY